jgi:hypothetical protein
MDGDTQVLTNVAARSEASGSTQVDVEPQHGIDHVLLLSVDGLHAVDLANCKAMSTCPHLDGLTAHGHHVQPMPVGANPQIRSPGMLAQVTGGSVPKARCRRSRPREEVVPASEYRALQTRFAVGRDDLPIREIEIVNPEAGNPSGL